MKSQMEMPFFGMTRKPRKLTEDEYEYLRTQEEPEQAAIVLMIEHGAYKHRQYMLAIDLGLGKKESSAPVLLSQIKSGQKNLRTSKIKNMEALTGVSALTDYWRREEFGAMYQAVVGLLEAGAAVTKAHGEQLRATG